LYIQSCCHAKRSGVCDLTDVIKRTVSVFISMLKSMEMKPCKEVTS